MVDSIDLEDDVLIKNYFDNVTCDTFWIKLYQYIYMYEKQCNIGKYSAQTISRKTTCFAIDHNTNALIAKIGFKRQKHVCPLISWLPIKDAGC